jgi:hypothetical protein
MASYHKVEYKLSNIPGFLELINSGKYNVINEKYYSIKEYSTKLNEKYNIVRYSKDLLTANLISSYGLLRSLVLSGSKVVSFAPPKSICADNFIMKYPVKNDNIIAEEFVEGTMINVFFDPYNGLNGCWQIATRNTVGAEVSFFKQSNDDSSNTFASMFADACIQNGLNIFTLNPSYCYSFVLQHPRNRIVVPFINAQLYLVAVYEIKQTESDIVILEQDMNIVKYGGMWNITKIKFPEMYEFKNYSELIEKYASANTPYNIVGVIIKNKDTGDRTKIRNPNYEEVRQLRGNQAKLQYQYLTLRRSGKIAEFLKYYPETKDQMSKFRDQVHMFTNTLHKNYISCYVKKEKPLKEFSDQYRTHMFKIHEKYLKDLRPNKLFVTNTVVIKYVNELPSSLLMYCLNYNMRKRMIDTIKMII